MTSAIYPRQMRAALLSVLRSRTTGTSYQVLKQRRGYHHSAKQNDVLVAGRGRGYMRSLEGVYCNQQGQKRGFRTSLTVEGTHVVNMPSLSPTMTEGTIVKWLKKEGDPIAAGDVLCEIQTDKAVMSMEHDEDGILAKILVPENTDVKVGTLIALTVDEGEDWKGVEVPASAPPPSKKSPESQKTETPKISTTAVTHSSQSHHSNERLLGPAVKLYLTKYGLNSGQVSRSGPHGTLAKGDVLKHVQQNNIKPVTLEYLSAGAAPTSATSSAPKSSKPKGQTPGPATYVDKEISSIRKTIAKRLLQSKSTIPHAYGTALCNVKSLDSFRKRLVSKGFKVSVNDLIIKCVANALHLKPGINCVREGLEVKQQSQVDISVAVATPTGLITPIVHNAGAKDVISIGDTVRTLAAKAKDGKLQPHEFMGGNFCISNLGMFGIHSFSAIINPPQCAILAVGGTITELGENGKPLASIKLILSYDASAIMEDDAIKFLTVLKNELENVSEISTGIFNLNARLDDVSASA